MAGGQMPQDVKEMLGLPVEDEKKKRIRSRSETRQGKQNETPKVKKPSVMSKSKSRERVFPPSLEEKFDQQDKRNKISAFLSKQKEAGPSQALLPKSPAVQAKNKAVIDALTEKITPAQPPPDAEPDSPRPKLNLADVIIAAAAAKTVKLKSTGKHNITKAKPNTLHLFLYRGSSSSIIRRSGTEALQANPDPLPKRRVGWL